MKSDNSAIVYNTESTAAGFNRVKGFDPLKYVRSTENGAVLDLPYQKLWFRLRHPNGKIRIFIKNLSEKIAAVEARVYFDRADSEPAANCIISGVDAEDKVSVAKAQHDAMEKALSDAGFGLQFMVAGCGNEKKCREILHEITEGKYSAGKARALHTDKAA